MVFAQEIALKLRGGSGRQGGLLVSNSQLPNFLPSNFDLKLKRAGTDKPTDFVAGDERGETQASQLAPDDRQPHTAKPAWS